MDQPWWVYGAIAFGCALLFLAAKIVESKYIRDEDGLFFFTIGLAVIGGLSALKAIDVLNIL